MSKKTKCTDSPCHHCPYFNNECKKDHKNISPPEKRLRDLRNMQIQNQKLTKMPPYLPNSNQL